MMMVHYCDKDHYQGIGHLLQDRDTIPLIYKP